MPSFGDPEHRELRHHVKSLDGRTAFERDRDRILYSEHLRRLAGITQVISPYDHTFHNRLTHTLEVAQIGRRMAQYILNDPNNRQFEPQQYVNADVVEAACLAHDLGHPPFGHVAEKHLDRLSLANGGNGFEGNAQSFRIITRLALHSDEFEGLDLTRATLNAVLKYPWFRSEDEKSYEFSKFGAYESDMDNYAFARQDFPGDGKSLEAQIMDHSDAIAYAVHDLIDFHKAGLLPIDHLLTDEGIAVFFNYGKNSKEIMRDVEEHFSLSTAQQYLIENIPKLGIYEGTKKDQVFLKQKSSYMIRRYVAEPTVNWRGIHPELVIPPQHLLEINFLKRIIWHYVIDRPQLGTQQHGMRQIIHGLFDIYFDSITADDSKGVSKDATDFLLVADRRIIPSIYQDDFRRLRARRDDKDPDQVSEVRLAIDIVAGFSDNQALEMYKRLLGVDPGKITDIIAI